MSTPFEHKTVQARILAYAQEIGWTLVPRAEAEQRRGFDPDGATKYWNSDFDTWQSEQGNGIAQRQWRDVQEP